ncbi:MAG: ATP-binding protein, partial [Thermomicrobiales bacterium]
MSETFAKRIKDDIARFVANPTHDGLQNLIQYFGGEFDQYELKEAWPALPRIAKSVLAIANSGGGVILFGIRDESLEPVGLVEFLPKQQVFDSLGEFLPGPLLNEVTMLDFDYRGAEYPPLQGKLIQVLAIPDLAHFLPFICEEAWSQDDTHLRRGAIYVRNGTQTVETTYERLQTLIGRHIEAVMPGGNVDELTQELAQLYALYVAQQRASHPNFWGTDETTEANAYHPDIRLADYLGTLITLQQVT